MTLPKPFGVKPCQTQPCRFGLTILRNQDTNMLPLRNHEYRRRSTACSPARAVVVQSSCLEPKKNTTWADRSVKLESSVCPPDLVTQTHLCALLTTLCEPPAVLFTQTKKDARVCVAALARSSGQDLQPPGRPFTPGTPLCPRVYPCTASQRRRAAQGWPRCGRDTVGFRISGCCTHNTARAGARAPRRPSKPTLQ